MVDERGLIQPGATLVAIASYVFSPKPLQLGNMQPADVASSNTEKTSSLVKIFGSLLIIIASDRARSPSKFMITNHDPHETG